VKPVIEVLYDKKLGEYVPQERIRIAV